MCFSVFQALNGEGCLSCASQVIPSALRAKPDETPSPAQGSWVRRGGTTEARATELMSTCSDETRDTVLITSCSNKTHATVPMSTFSKEARASEPMLTCLEVAKCLSA